MPTSTDFFRIFCIYIIHFFPYVMHSTGDEQPLRLCDRAQQTTKYPELSRATHRIGIADPMYNKINNQ